MFKEVYQTQPSTEARDKSRETSPKPWEEMNLEELLDTYYQGDWDKKSKLQTLQAYNLVQASLINNIAQEMVDKMGLDEFEAKNIIAVRYAELFSNKFRQDFDGYTKQNDKK